MAQRFSNPEVIQRTQGFYAEQKYRPSQTIGPIVTKTATVYWIVAHKTWHSGSSDCLGPDSLCGLASLDVIFSHSSDNLPPPGGHWGNVRKSTWNLLYPCISTIYLGLRQYLYVLPSPFKGTSLLHCCSSNLLVSSDIRGEKSGCSGLTQLLLVSPQCKSPLRQRNACVPQRAWNERIPEIHSLRTPKIQFRQLFCSSEKFFFFRVKK